MTGHSENDPLAEEMWRIYMTTGEAPRFARSPWYESKVLRPLVRLLPMEPRCRVCYYRSVE
jgi:hypothetical protein